MRVFLPRPNTTSCLLKSVFDRGAVFQKQRRKKKKEDKLCLSNERLGGLFFLFCLFYMSDVSWAQVHERA